MQVVLLQVWKMRLLVIIVAACLLASCGKRSVQPQVPPPPAPPVERSQRPSAKSEIIEHCVITRQENENTVTCECDPVRTWIDVKTGRTRVACRAVPAKTLAQDGGR